MQDLESYLDAKLRDDDQLGILPHKSPDDLVDQFGIRVSLLILWVGLLIAAISVVSRPSFGKCSALENIMERNTCYDQLRGGLLEPPAKGADSRVYEYTR
jgi:hypothetical protein